MEQKIAARLTGVTRRYTRDAETVTPVRDVTLSLASGTIVALTGPSGSGKSTLLNLIAGFDRPDEGNIVVGDLDLNAISPVALDMVRSRHIGFVFQQFNLIQGLSARENVGLALVPAGIAVGERHRRADEQLALLGLGGLGHRRPRELSGGQQQRVALARALVGKPSLLLSDEPTAALDRDSADGALALLRYLAESGMAVLIATHDPRCTAAADRVVVLDRGRLS